MSEEPISQENPEVRTIRHLVRLMQKYDLTAIDLGDGPTRIRLRRRGVEVVSTAQSPVYAPAPVQIHAAPSSAAPSATPPLAATPAGLVIESPMVGTFYASTSPDSPPLVSVGTAIRSDTTVCVIEAMKVFTDIPAGLSGTVTEVLVKNGQPVEFGQPLFRLAP